MGILKTDIIDRERGMELNLARNEDILDDCSKESRGKWIVQNKNTDQKTSAWAWIIYSLSMNLDQKDMCFRAYFFLRCVAISNLIYDDAK